MCSEEERVEEWEPVRGGRFAYRRQRVEVRSEGGRTVYAVRGWCGWDEVSGTLVFVAVGAVGLGVYIFTIRHMVWMLEAFLPGTWAEVVVSFMIGSAFNIWFFCIFGVLLLWLPYFLLYQLSPKKLWIDGEALYHRVAFLGIVPRTQRIEFDRIMDIEVVRSGSLHHLKAVYEMKLPRWLWFVLVYWNEKFTVTSKVLVNGIVRKEEAEWLQGRLMEPMTRG